jgi:hypothetical protein
LRNKKREEKKKKGNRGVNENTEYKIRTCQRKTTTTTEKKHAHKRRTRYLPIPPLGGEGIHGPIVYVRGHDVVVRIEYYDRPIGMHALPPRDDDRTFRYRFVENAYAHEAIYRFKTFEQVRRAVVVRAAGCRDGRYGWEAYYRSEGRDGVFGLLEGKLDRSGAFVCRHGKIIK